jgi:RNA polymerase sigma factor (sigma-70 family)
MYRQAVTEDLTRAQLEAAHLGFFGLLRRKRMSPAFIDRHGEDLLAQASFEYTRQLREGKVIRKPVAWIVVCAWHRTVGLLETRDRTPRMVSTERVGELSADATPTPDDDVLAEDRYRKVREAVEHLPEYQRQLLSLSYFEGASVREAARKLGWTPSKAQRAHESAQRKLKKLLGVETSDALEPIAGLAAFLTFGPDGCSRVPQLIGGFEGAADSIVHKVADLAEHGLDLLRRPFGHGGHSPSENAEALGDLGRRALAGAQPHGPAAFAANAGRRAQEFGRRMVGSGAVESTAAAADGGVRVAEACKAIAAVCLIGGGAITGGALLDSSNHHRPEHSAVRPAAVTARLERAQPRSVVTPDLESTTADTPPAEAKAATATEGQPRPELANRVPGGGQTSSAQRRAQHHEAEEDTAEQSFNAMNVASSEAESPSAPVSSDAAVASGEARPTSKTESAALTPKARAEEGAVKTQFQGGLP